MFWIFLFSIFGPWGSETKELLVLRFSSTLGLLISMLFTFKCFLKYLEYLGCFLGIDLTFVIR